ncbi:MAG: penicillin-binding protein [Solirubrobacteraceae bacterium]|jgi:peptidoglycan glycosyltransferase|nr:penicillin-binding protein [Solirubrobacteraceae bacterium]
MNAPIARLFVLVLLLFAALVAFTSRWSVFEAQALRDNPKNRRALLEELRVKRGTIRSNDGTLLARSAPAGAGTYRRVYTDEAALAAHVIGFSDVDLGRAGIERSRNEELAGEATGLDDLVQQLRGKVEQGNDVRLSIDLRAQRAAEQFLNGRRGSVVAIEPATGRIRAMASVPGYNPQDLQQRASRAALDRDRNGPLLNRATQAGYPPGSTFKVVTATAALDSGRFTPDSVVNGDSPKEISGVPLANSGDKSFGDISLTTALTFSVNTVWAQVAEQLGKGTMADYMRRFGFNADPPLDYPKDQIFASGEYRNGALLPPTSRFVDVGRMGIGQDKLRVTPLQMAMVAATVANGGELMRPTLTQSIVDPDGRADTVEPERERRVMSEKTAAELTSMMENVVREGTGTAAALQGIDVAGKTGTAEIDRDEGINQPWFIGFAPAKDPKIAVSVTIEQSQGGQGGTEAAPIAKQVLEALLR